MPNNLTDAEETRLLDLSLINGDKVALYTGVGTDAAAGTELAGGSYARQEVDWDAAAAGAKTSDGALLFLDLPAAEVIGWAVWNSAGSSRKWYGVFAPVLAKVVAATDTFTAPAHGLIDGTKVVLQAAYAPGGTTAGTVYFVVGATSNTFKLSATIGGAVLDVTSDLDVAVVGRVQTIPAGGSLTIADGGIVCSLS